MEPTHPTYDPPATVRLCASAELRVCDAERDQAATALGRRFQAGRLDRAEVRAGKAVLVRRDTADS